MNQNCSCCDLNLYRLADRFSVAGSQGVFFIFRQCERTQALIRIQCGSVDKGISFPWPKVAEYEIEPNIHSTLG